MNMSDLKTGMSVTTRDGRHYRVARDYKVDDGIYDLLISGSCPMILFFSDYENDMTLRKDTRLPNPDIKDLSSFDIVTVQQNGQILWYRS